MSETFRVPAFYMPFQVRLNPYLDEVRPQVREWAQSIGLLEAQHTDSSHGGWDEEVFQRADFSLFTALTYPDAPAQELRILSCWHTVIWCTDDTFLPWYEALGDRAKILQRIERLMAFLPVTSQATPSPQHVLERALADLWSQTRDSATLTWRLRYTDSVRKFLDASLWESDNLFRNREPDLIEQIEMRREYGAAGCSALLMEHAHRWEAPAEVQSLRPFQALINAFRDTVDLHNDIVSYSKEVREGVAQNNMVHVAHRIHGGSLQSAVDHVNQILTGRIVTLKDTVENDLPQALHDIKADSETQVRTLRHGRALQGWAAGSYHWHQMTGRYRKTTLIG